MHTQEEEPARWVRELTMLAALAAAFGGGELLRAGRSPRALGRPANVPNRLDRVVRERLRARSWGHGAERTADALAFIAMPAGCLLLLRLLRPSGTFAKDALRSAQAVLLVGALNQAVKALAPRDRPFATQGGLAAPRRDVRGSFFSNHTSTMAALAAITSRRLASRGSGRWPALPLLCLAASVGYLRIAADAHYLTDVIAGAAFGAAVGWSLGR
jgi:membrane-associated phospholipid phosphatase